MGEGNDEFRWMIRIEKRVCLNRLPRTGAEIYPADLGMKTVLGCNVRETVLLCGERLALMLMGQRLRCKGSELSFVNVNGRGDEGGPIGKVLLNALT